MASIGLLAACTTASHSALNYEATFADLPNPFEFQVKEYFLQSVKEKIALTRLPTSDLGVPVYSEGPTIANATAVLDHWRYKYDWERQQTSINRLPFIERLTDPVDDSEPAFHVVVPDIPGFGLSPAPRTTGFGPTQAGHAFNALMHQLGYPNITRRAYEVGRSTPVDWLQRGASLTALIEHDAGGHFAAYQDPTLVDDIRQFLGNHSASGTAVFH
ncbi:hypothetical protein LTR10_001912 [Elasticomyces elasticus]|nr:hypothetical protein LTR10_001912 [Elasticomyces elasticus]